MVRMSIQRSQIHYDPAKHSQNRSNSVQGEIVDFNYPKRSELEGPGSAHLSDSVVLSTVLVPPQLRMNKPADGAELVMDRLPTVPGSGRLKGTSDASQGSIDDFYDSYYRRSAQGAESGLLAPS